MQESTVLWIHLDCGFADWKNLDFPKYFANSRFRKSAICETFRTIQIWRDLSLALSERSNICKCFTDSKFWKYTDFGNVRTFQIWMSITPVTFFRRSAAASIASPFDDKETTSHPSLLFHLNCEPFKSMACCKIKPVIGEIRKLHLGFGTETVRRLEVHSEKDIIFSSVPKYA